MTTSERLNSIHSKLRDFCKRQAGHVFFKETVRLTNKRYAHFDVLVKSAAIEIDGFNVGLRYDDLKDVFESSNNFSPNSIVAKRIKNALKFLHTALPNNISVLRNRSMIQSFINLACTIVESKADKGNEVAFGKFVAHFASELSKQVEMGHSATDLDYISFQKTVNANVRSGALTRHQIMVRKLLQFHPEFAEALTADSIAASGIKDYVAEIGGRISERITRVNEIYASTNGVDLFKPTNKTISSLSEIGKLISDFDGYKSFVDALYFLFWEGPGSKLSGSEPLSFKDVNDLRTALQHDVDHGKASKVKSKRKKLGSTFQKYSGALAPTAMSPDRFPVVQLAVLTAIESDLRALEGAL